MADEDPELAAKIPALEELIQLHDLDEQFSPQQRLNLAHLSAFFDKFYYANDELARFCCRICEESYPHLIRAACGCFICTRCLYCELPSIPLSKCPYCSCFEVYNIETPQKVQKFNFSPLKPSVEEGNLTTSHQIKVLEIYPVTLAQEENEQLLNEEVLCRFHKELGGGCDQLINCDFQRYAEHLSECKKTGQRELEVQSFMPKRMDILRHCEGLVSPAARQLFADLQPQLMPAKEVPQHRSPVIFEPICRRLLIERGEPTRYPKYANFQLLCFPNPLENCDLSACCDIVCGMRILYPDDTFEELEFWVQKDHLMKCGILRFFGRVCSRLLGRYVFDIRYACLFNADDQFWVYSTKELVKYCVVDVASDIKPINELLLQDEEEVNHAVSGYRLRLEIGEKLVAEGCELFKRGKQDEVQARVIQFEELESLLSYGIFSCFLEDAMAFASALHGFCLNKINQRVLVASTALDVLIDIMDRFSDVYCVQKAAIDLIMLIVQQQEDMNVMSLKVPGLFGRLRRIKHQFINTDSIDQLLNMLFRVSAIAAPDEALKPEKLGEVEEIKQE